ncbi:MAG: YjdF family protein [Anaerolineae bacterium]
MKLTILFDPPYWVGVLEEERDGFLYAARYIFGAEPSDQEVLEFVQHELSALQAHMTRGIPLEQKVQKAVNPKRVQREIRREIAQQGISTKAQEAMRLQIESNKAQRKQTSRAEREAERERQYQLSREKARQKHRGH